MLCEGISVHFRHPVEPATCRLWLAGCGAPRRVTLAVAAAEEAQEHDAAAARRGGAAWG
jgi:hypothetical protein